MNPAFVRRHAPALALKAPGSKTGGMTGPEEHPYDASGTPLPYLESGGQRQYFGIPGLRDRFAEAEDTHQPPAQPEFDAPISDVLTITPPNRRTDQPLYGPGGIAPPATARIPPPTFRDELPPNIELRGLMPPDMAAPSPVDVMGRGAPRGTARIPPSSRQMEDRIVDNVRSGRVDPVNTTGLFERAMRNPQGMTLGDYLQQLNSSLPEMLGIRGRRPSATAQIPPNDRFLRDANTLGELPNFSSEQGLADFNRRMGLQLGPQVRSQAEQDRLRAAGRTTAVTSYHTRGAAADITPRHLGGLRGQAAVDEVRRRLTAAGYPDMEVIWESGRGRGQGTGPHVHIEPRRAQ